jgi:hypothetical protein
VSDGRDGAVINRTLRLLALMAAVALLTGCTGAAPSGPLKPSQLVEASTSPTASLSPDAALPSGEATLAEGCFLTAAEVEAATGHALTSPPDASFGPKGDASCQYYLAGEPMVGAFGCHCLSTNGPFDLEGQGTAWLDSLPSGGESVPGVGDGAYVFNGSTASDFWAVKGQTGIHISIAQQSLTVEQFTVLANAAFDRIATST